MCSRNLSKEVLRIFRDEKFLSWAWDINWVKIIFFQQIRWLVVQNFWLSVYRILGWCLIVSTYHRKSVWTVLWSLMLKQFVQWLSAWFNPIKLAHPPDISGWSKIFSRDEEIKKVIESQWKITQFNASRLPAVDRSIWRILDKKLKKSHREIQFDIRFEQIIQFYMFVLS